VVIILRELAEHSPEAAAFDVDEHSGNSMGESKTGLGSDVEAGRKTGDLEVGG
jgi:hypothetical protein